jgi:hypothetical protein
MPGLLYSEANGPTRRGARPALARGMQFTRNAYKLALFEALLRRVVLNASTGD